MQCEFRSAVVQSTKRYTQKVLRLIVTPVVYRGTWRIVTHVKLVVLVESGLLYPLSCRDTIFNKDFTELVNFPAIHVLRPWSMAIGFEFRFFLNLSV